MTVAYAALGVLLLLVLWVVLSFAALARARKQVREAWSRLDAQLSRRHELVPALVEVVRRSLPGERETLKVITGARAAAVLAREPAMVAQTEARLTSALVRIDALAEAHPQLRAADGFQRLRDELVAIEDDIHAARGAYNAAVQDYNARGRRFRPLALGRTQPHELSEVERPVDGERPAKRSVPKVAF